MDALALDLAAAYAAFPAVTAVALAGSQTTGVADAASDIDLYVYLDGPLPLEARRAVARGPRVELDNRFFEPGDEWLTDGGVVVDAMFRDTRWLEDQLERTLVRCEANIGYSTAFWHNVRSSRVLFDRAGWLARQVARAQAPYPEALRRSVIAKNLPLLGANLSSFRHQLARAIARGDAPAANHRAAAFLASAFDVVFALARTPHPGEKRLLAHAARLDARWVPPDLDATVRAMVAAAGRLDAAAVTYAERLATAIEAVVAQDGGG